MKRCFLLILLLAGLVGPAERALAYDSELAARTFETAWTAVTESYYDTTFAGLDWEAMGAAYRKRVEASTSDDELRGIIEEMISSLGESHFAILSRSPLSTKATLTWRTVTTPGGRQVGLIRFDSWMLSSSQKFDQAMDALRETEGMIVDLRGNPGGLIPMLIGVSGHFLDQRDLLGTLIARKNRIEIRANPRHIDTQGNYVEPYSGPLAILVDERSYSASEFFAAGMQGLGRGVVVGRPTTGLALGATYTMLPNGDVLEHAVSDFLSSRGERVEGNGVTPNVLVEGDPLAAALKWVDARAIVDRYVALVGGAEAFEACKDRMATGKMLLPAQGLSGELVIYAKAPDKMLVTIDLPGMGMMSTGYDGVTGWLVQPMMGPMLLEGKSLEQLRVQSRYDEALKTHPGVQSLELVGEKTIGGVDCFAVKTTYTGDFEQVEYYAKESGLIVGVDGEQETPMGNLTVFTAVSAYGPCGPVQISMRTSQQIMGMEQIVEIEDCRCVDVPDSIFALPPAIQTLKDHQ